VVGWDWSNPFRQSTLNGGGIAAIARWAIKVKVSSGKAGGFSVWGPLKAV
jgi:hypothetical protein